MERLMEKFNGEVFLGGKLGEDDCWMSAVVLMF